MKNKHLVLCLIGFIVFVHAHYFNSWINYYEAPVRDEKQSGNSGVASKGVQSVFKLSKNELLDYSDSTTTVSDSLGADFFDEVYAQ